jgi:hypothetical protein
VMACVSMASSPTLPLFDSYLHPRLTERYCA